MLKILEQSLIGKRSSELCEDNIAITDSIVAVIDGATSKSSMKYNGKLGGRLAMELISEALANINFKLLPIDKLRYISDYINKFKIDNNIEFNIIGSIILYDDYYKRIISYGDCRCLINGRFLIGDKKCDVYAANERAKFINELLNSGHTINDLINNDLSRVAIMPILRANEAKANIDYPCINGSEIKEDLVVEFKVGYNDMVVLASDGYPRLYNTLSESEDYLKYVLTNDPLCYKIYKSTKGLSRGNISYDDRAYIKFIVK